MNAASEMHETTHSNVLVIGASRGLGKAIVETYVHRGARVVGTVRASSSSDLAGFAKAHPAAVEIEQVDITDPSQIMSLRERLADRAFDLLFVVAGVSLAPRGARGADIPTADFDLMMETNVLGVMRTVEILEDLVVPDGTIAVMSSGQGSITNNENAGFEVYRATKSALNQMFRSFAVRSADGKRALLLMAPGWVRTEMGGPDASLEIDESIPPLIDAVDAQRGVPGLQFLDRNGDSVPW